MITQEPSTGEKAVRQLGLLRSDEVDSLSPSKLEELDTGLRRLFELAVPVKASKEKSHLIWKDFAELLVIVGLTLPRRHYESGNSAFRYRSMFRDSKYTPVQRLEVLVESQKAIRGNYRWQEDVAETFKELVLYRGVEKELE